MSQPGRDVSKQQMDFLNARIIFPRDFGKLHVLLWLHCIEYSQLRNQNDKE